MIQWGCEGAVDRRTDPSKMCGAIGSRKVRGSLSAHALEQLTISGLHTTWSDRSGEPLEAADTVVVATRSDTG